MKRDITAMCTWAINSFAAGVDTSGIFMTASRINHSCLPNAHHCWNPTLEQLTVQAVRDIKQGEELEIAYIDVACRPQDIRQGELNRYCFVCSCVACSDTPFGRDSNKRRKKLMSLDEDIDMFDSMPFLSPINDMTGLLNTAREIYETLIEEGYHSRRLASV